MEAVQVANFFIEKSISDKSPITNMKLLKLVYIGYGWVAATIEEPLFTDPIEAWRHGPVVASLYHEFKHFGAEPIDDYACKFDLDSELMSYPKIPETEKDIIDVLDMVWEVYKQFSGWTLREKTHEPGTPWSQVFYGENEKVCENSIIGFDCIKSYFIGRIKEYLEYGATREAAA